MDVAFTIYAILECAIGLFNGIIRRDPAPQEIIDHMVYLICDLMLNPNKTDEQKIGFGNGFIT